MGSKKKEASNVTIVTPAPAKQSSGDKQFDAGIDLLLKRPATPQPTPSK